MSKLRSYAPLSKKSEKVTEGEAEFRAVYKVVDERSEGRCEYRASPIGVFTDDPGEILRCTRRAADHHHLYKPRRSNHDPLLIVHLCRDHHDRCDWPYKRGKLVVSLFNGRHSYQLVTAADKFALRSGL